ncbi:hypothetical protein SteCoe_19855 [Stentor coeruleus]|uniref:Uncharacterized protein n=1 Tax=Stentor coeruleus TaxID=5963 RepID=A0A1R2BTA8_9CILI|nr:hypothetical protein SteCoe_19855 [Stentor coeruleus]
MKNRNSDSLIYSYNRKAMDHLNNENYNKAYSYLNKAQDLLSSLLLQNPQKLHNITLNNFACFYKKTGNPLSALNFLKKALEISSKPPVDIKNLAATHLNISAIFSFINDHNNALFHSLKAFNLLKAKFLEDPDVVTTLLVAHHNTGVEYEYLSQMPSAFSIYARGYKISQEHLGDEHPLTQSLKRSMHNTQVTRITTSVSPIRSSPITTFNKTQGSVPRSFKNSTRTSVDIPETMLKIKTENIRFVTGERLQPMFKHFRSENKSKTAVRTKNRKSIKAIDLIGESPKDMKNFSVNVNLPVKDSDKQFISTGEDSKNLNIDINDKTITEESRSSDRVSIATQVESFDRNLLKKLRNSAAIAIQKYCRGFIAKKKYQIIKYTRQLEDAEKQAKLAKDRLTSLKQFRTKRTSITDNEIPKGPIPTIKTELVPKVYKDKLNSTLKLTSQWSQGMQTRRNIFLSPIPEESENFSGRVISIQSHYRGWSLRKEFLKKRKAIVTIQKHVRRYLTRKLYKKIIEAVVFIQRIWREYLNRKNLD